MKGRGSIAGVIATLLLVSGCVVTTSGCGTTSSIDLKTSAQKPGFPASDPTRDLAATRITPLDPSSGWGGGSDATVFEGLTIEPATPSRQLGGEWWATVLAVGANVKGGRVLGVGTVTSASDLNEGRPTYRVGRQGWSTGSTPSQIKAAIRTAAASQGFRIERLSVHSSAAGPAAAVIVTPAGSNDAIAYLLTHRPLHVSEIQQSAAVFTQVVDAKDQVVYADGEVPNTVSLSWADPKLRCHLSITGCP